MRRSMKIFLGREKNNMIKRKEKIERAMRLAWSSLESHLKWTYCKSAEGKIFHMHCVKEYSELIKILSELY